MAEEGKKEVTPEEKLLKVIQGGREKKAEAAPAATAVPAVSAAAAREPAPLKLAKPAVVKPDAAPKAAGPVSAGAPPPEAPEARPPARGALPELARSIRKRAAINGWRATNRALAGAIILVLALISLEIRSGIVSIGMLGQSSVATPTIDLVAVKEYTPAAAPIGQLIKIPGAKDAAAVNGVAQADWQLYARSNMRYIGTSLVGSALEAIVHDKKTGKMHYLRTGAVLPIEDKDVSVVEVQGEAIILTDGEAKLPLN
jgi:hypothetical protein